MSLRIACDLDGTVADMDAALQREAQRLFGPDVALRAFPGDRLESAEDVEGHMVPGAPKAVPMGGPRALTPKEIRRLWEHVNPPRIQSGASFGWSFSCGLCGHGSEGLQHNM